MAFEEEKITLTVNVGAIGVAGDGLGSIELDMTSDLATIRTGVNHALGEALADWLPHFYAAVGSEPPK